jgi:leader peptidase (prepilin peptidase)/N-methyltransferase
MPRAFDVPLLLGAAFVMGSAIGSFANVCIYRMPRKRRYLEEVRQELARGKDLAAPLRENLEAQVRLLEKEALPEGHTIARPRSFCPGCRRPIPWWDNIPVLSYALLNGRCRACSVRIPLRYPLVEVLVGALFALLCWKHLSQPVQFPLPVALVMAAFCTSLMIVTFIDIDFRIIPYPLSLGITALAIPVSMLIPALHTEVWPPWSTAFPASPLEAGGASLAGIIVGAGVIDVMGLIGMGYLWIKQTLKSCQALAAALGRSTLTRWLVTGPSDPLKDTVVGGGDLHLMTAVGGLLGWKAAVVVTFFLAPLVGGSIGMIRLLFTKDPYIAYGPFLALGTLGFILFGSDMLALVGAIFDPQLTTR